mmetsp:Transcript_17900/g.39311  ORF Transcript_17900/g.39311 Transcript_17900/m.39311 type:complete len:220 (+) Transcript_17900:546-1205(+)
MQVQLNQRLGRPHQLAEGDARLGITPYLVSRQPELLEVRGNIRQRHAELLACTVTDEVVRKVQRLQGRPREFQKARQSNATKILQAVLGQPQCLQPPSAMHLLQPPDAPISETVVGHVDVARLRKGEVRAESFHVAVVQAPALEVQVESTRSHRPPGVVGPGARAGSTPAAGFLSHQVADTGHVAILAGGSSPDDRSIGLQRLPPTRCCGVFHLRQAGW